eukprot:Nk52_evm101s226 gene=Nk52_evmTU101s226
MVDLGFKDKHVFVTGSSGGVGKETARSFLEQGARATLQYNSNSSALDDLVKEFPETAFPVQCTLTDEASVDRAYAAAVQRHGPVSILTVIHGIWPSQDLLIADMELSHWQNTIDVNLTSSFLITRAFMRGLRRDWTKEMLETENIAVVVVGSTAGKFGEAYHCDYSVTKSALMGGFILSLKNEIVKLAPRGRVNAVAPGWIRTPMAERAMNDPDLLFQALCSSPLKRVSEPLDVANSILFLCSGKMSGNITGHTIDLNAGMEGRLLNKREDFGN